MDLAQVVAPATPARERTLPAAEALRPLLPDGALRRGWVLGCRGAAAPSLAVGLAVEAVRQGAWLAVVDVAWFGIEAAAGAGLALERVVRVDSGSAGWAEVVAAALDGFDLVLTVPPARLRAGVARRVRARVQARGAVLVTLDQAMEGTDLVLSTSGERWDQAAGGHGHLRARHVQVDVTGRRAGRPTRLGLLLPGPSGALGPDETASRSPAAPAAPRLRTAG